MVKWTLESDVGRVWICLTACLPKKYRVFSLMRKMEIIQCIFHYWLLVFPSHELLESIEPLCVMNIIKMLLYNLLPMWQAMKHLTSKKSTECECVTVGSFLQRKTGCLWYKTDVKVEGWRQPAKEIIIFQYKWKQCIEIDFSSVDIHIFTSLIKRPVPGKPKLTGMTVLSTVAYL